MELYHVFVFFFLIYNATLIHTVFNHVKRGKENIVDVNWIVAEGGFNFDNTPCMYHVTLINRILVFFRSCKNARLRTNIKIDGYKIDNPLWQNGALTLHWKWIKDIIPVRCIITNLRNKVKHLPPLNAKRDHWYHIRQS